jgi:hypothetical protein
MWVSGRQRRSAARWILVVRPPRDRPSASRPPPGLAGFAPAACGFLSFGPAPPGQLRRPGTAGTSRVLVGADHGGVRADRPVPPLSLVAPGPQHVQDPRPGPIQRPAAMPPVDAAPVPEPRRQVTPRAAGPGAEQDAVHHHAVIVPAVSLPRMLRHQRRQPFPLLIGEVMTIQVIIHPERSTPSRTQDLRDTP